MEVGVAETGYNLGGAALLDLSDLGAFRLRFRLHISRHSKLSTSRRIMAATATATSHTVS